MQSKITENTKKGSNSYDTIVIIDNKNNNSPKPKGKSKGKSSKYYIHGEMIALISSYFGEL